MGFINNKITNKFLSIISTLVLTSCVNGTIYGELLSNLSSLFFEDNNISIEKVNSVPYASLQVKIGNSKNSLLVLEEEVNDIDFHLKKIVFNYLVLILCLMKHYVHG